MNFDVVRKNDFWGKYGFPSYSDHGVSLETKLAVLQKIGYIDNKFLEFHGWIGTKSEGKLGENYDDLSPSNVRLDYKPSLIVLKPLKVDLVTEYHDNVIGYCPGCKIPAIPTIIDESWLPYPKEKNEQTWNLFYDQIIQVLKTIESRLATVEWFFPNDNFDLFDRPKTWKNCTWKFKGKAVEFKRISFGFYGDYWGTLWWYSDEDEEKDE
jgi:hypothetical protein